MHAINQHAFFVTTLQGWAYKNKTNMRDALMIVWGFLCNNIARMGLQNTTNTRDACEQSDAFFVTILQGWVYKTQQTREMHASNHTLFCNNIARMGLQNTANTREIHWWSSEVFFVTILQGWVYKTQKHSACDQSTRFLCNNIARMGLQKQNKHARCIDDRLRFSL